MRVLAIGGLAAVLAVNLVQDDLDREASIGALPGRVAGGTR
ncbi:hypothetical protein [Propioniciclava sp. MC1683]|nr:hypothetical protein [Propioniciclava sp. MC1683]